MLDFDLADRKKKKAEKGNDSTNGANEDEDGEIPGESQEDKKEVEGEGEDDDYMDSEMKEADERSRTRINIIFREFKNELESYVPPGTEKTKSGSGKGKSQGKVSSTKNVEYTMY